MFQAVFGFFMRPSKMSHQSPEMNDSLTNWLHNRLKWVPTSIEALENAEKRILSYIKKPFTLKYVAISNKEFPDQAHKIRTISINENQSNDKMALVLLHGLGSALGLWVLNLDTFSNDRPVYAFDIIGFGLSSRPHLRGSAKEIEEQLVESIEQWRQEMNLKKFVLLGHSMGGFLASAYALKYPDKIGHLILADPWGFPERSKTARRPEIPMWMRMIATVLQYFNPMLGLRVAGPWGPGLVNKVRPDILQKFGGTVNDLDIVSDYIYHCNVQTPTGETAFKAMCQGIGWARCPMINRIVNMREDIPITFIYGSKSWVDSQSGYAVQVAMKNSKVNVVLVNGAGHHVYADHADAFNSIVMKICKEVDAKKLSVDNEQDPPLNQAYIDELTSVPVC